jgi:hypothetical protein
MNYLPANSIYSVKHSNMLPLHNRGNIIRLQQLRRDEKKELDRIKRLPNSIRTKKATQIKVKYQKLQSELRHKFYIKSLGKT